MKDNWDVFNTLNHTDVHVGKASDNELSYARCSVLPTPSMSHRIVTRKCHSDYPNAS